MSLTATQRQILRDMAGGARIEYQNGVPLLLPPAAFVGGRQIDLADFRELLKADCIHFALGELGRYRIYTLTPAGAEAAREAK